MSKDCRLITSIFVFIVIISFSLRFLVNEYKLIDCDENNDTSSSSNTVIQENEPENEEPKNEFVYQYEVVQVQPTREETETIIVIENEGFSDDEIIIKPTDEEVNDFISEDVEEVEKQKIECSIPIEFTNETLEDDETILNVLNNHRFPSDFYTRFYEDPCLTDSIVSRINFFSTEDPYLAITAACLHSYMTPEDLLFSALTDKFFEFGFAYKNDLIRVRVLRKSYMEFTCDKNIYFGLQFLDLPDTTSDEKKSIVKEYVEYFFTQENKFTFVKPVLSSKITEQENCYVQKIRYTHLDNPSIVVYDQYFGISKLDGKLLFWDVNQVGKRSFDINPRIKSFC